MLSKSIDIIRRLITNIHLDGDTKIISELKDNLVNFIENNNYKAIDKEVIDQLQNFIDYLQNKQEALDENMTTNFSKTLLIHHDIFYKHTSIKEINLISRVKRREVQVENPDRLQVLLNPDDGVFYSQFFNQRFIIKECTKKAEIGDILKCHDFNYIERVRSICEEYKNTNKDGVYKFDTDTCINQHTWESSEYAAGAVIEAVDSLMKNEFLTAVCLVRPPGHHAGYFGRVE
jgi:hypothetical protein